MNLDKILTIDLSTNTGWAFFSEDKLIEYGLIDIDTPNIMEPDETYPKSWVMMSLDLANQLSDLIDKLQPTIIIIEETNKASRFTSRYSQKCLEYCHAFLNYTLILHHPNVQVKYIDTSKWRKILNFPIIKTFPEYLEKVPTGKNDYKWQSVILVNKMYGLQFKKVNNDIADAINIGTAWIINKNKT